jgi:DNA-directed RNA polymerase subunit M/transcription elongation factor TFIIS
MDKEAYYKWCSAQKREGWAYKDEHHWDSPFYKQKQDVHEIESLCPKCKHTRAIPFSVQERSMDEGMTNYLRCSLCGHTTRI